MTGAQRIYKSISDLQSAEIRSIYDGFDSSIAAFDCGQKCAPHNPSGKPFCCDISPADAATQLKSDTPKEMILLARLGPSRCEREARALSCRQFPFFPYVT